MSEHYIEKCEKCKTVISQCRCPSSDKIEKWSICENCKKLRKDVIINVPTISCGVRK